MDKINLKSRIKNAQEGRLTDVETYGRFLDAIAAKTVDVYFDKVDDLRECLANLQKYFPKKKFQTYGDILKAVSEYKGNRKYENPSVYVEGNNRCYDMVWNLFLTFFGHMFIIKKTRIKELHSPVVQDKLLYVLQANPDIEKELAKYKDYLLDVEKFSIRDNILYHGYLFMDEGVTQDMYLRQFGLEEVEKYYTYKCLPEPCFELLYYLLVGMYVERMENEKNGTD